MRILLIGASGTIGSALGATLRERGDEVVAVGHSSGDYTVDLASKRSIAELYDAVGHLDAVVCAAGLATFGLLEKLSDADLELSLANKLMGQVNLVRLGVTHVPEGASFTLTTGGLSQDPAEGTSAVSMVGAAVESFARAAAIDLGARYRVNVVSPGWVAESRIKMGLEPMPGIWAKDLAAYYVRSIDGDFTGRVLDAESPLETP